MTRAQEKGLYAASVLAPHIMLVVGLLMMTRSTDKKTGAVGLTVCKLSAIVLIAGSVLYYLFATPFFDLL
jgi:hypothetical protein